MSKKKKKARTGPKNPMTAKSTSNLLDLIISEKFRDSNDPAVAALKERRQEGLEETLNRIKQSENPEELTLYSEVLATLCQDEEEYSQLIREVEKSDSEKGKIMIAGYWRVPKFKSKDWIWDKLKKTIIADEKLLYYQLLIDRFLDTQAARDSLFIILRRNMTDHLPYFKKSLAKFLAYRGLSFIREEIPELPREEAIFLSGAWAETMEMKDLMPVEIGDEKIDPLGEEGILKEQMEVLKTGVNSETEGQLNIFLYVHRSHYEQNEFILPYLDSPSWRVRFEAIYRLFPGDDFTYINKLWEIYRREHTAMEEQYAIISVLSNCSMQYTVDGFIEVLEKFQEPISNRMAVSSAVPIPEKTMVERLSEKSPIIKWVNALRKVAGDKEDKFIVRFSCNSILSKFLEEDYAQEWSPMDQMLNQVARGEKVEIEKFKEFGLDLVEPLVYLHSVMQGDQEVSGVEVDILKVLGPQVNDRIIEILKGGDIIGQVNAIRMLTVFPEEKTAEAMLELLPVMIENEKHMIIRTMSQSLSYHREYNNKIADNLLEILKKDQDEYVVQCLATTLCALGQPRVLPLLFKMIQEGKVYGMSWEHLTRAVGNLCKERDRALEIIEEKMEDDDNPIVKTFADSVALYLMQERNAAMQEMDDTQPGN